MATYTKFRNLTSIELLNRVQEAREHNPIIEELAQRLEAYVVDGASAKLLPCPYCEATIKFEFDAEGEANATFA